MESDRPFVETHVSLFDHLGLDVRDQFVFVNEHAITWECDRDLDYLGKMLRDHGKRLLLAFDTNPTTIFDPSHTRQYLLDLTANFGDRVLLLSHNLAHLFEPCAEIYFPYFLVQQQQEKNLQILPKVYRFSFLSNQPRFHRLWLYQQVKESIIDHDCFAVHFDANTKRNHHFIMSYCRHLLGEEKDLSADLPFFHAHALDPFARSLPADRSRVDWSNAHEAYRAVYNITGESTCEDQQIFFTEKTWKSIRSRCLTINLGSGHANQYLSRLGFLTDHDIDLPLPDKVKWISERMATMTMTDALDQYQRYQHVIEHNFQRFYSEDLLRLFRGYLRDRLKIS